MAHDAVRTVAPALADALEAEIDRQQRELHLIASENHVSPAVLDAQSSVLTNSWIASWTTRP